MRLKPVGWAGGLGAVTLGGWLLRLYALNFGLPGLYDPDELMFELGAIRMLTHGSLNPGWFGHPATTTMYGLAIVNMATFGFGHLMGWFPTLKSFGLAIYTNPAWMILPGRVLMTLFGAGTVWQTGRLGRELFDRRTGLIAAALVALSPQCVAWAQVIRSDIMGSFFILLGLRAALRAGGRESWRGDLVVAAWLGVAVATKWPMGLASLGLAGLMLRRALADGAARGARPALCALVMRGLRFIAMLVGVTVLVSPYLVLAWRTVVLNLHGEAQMHHLGATGGSPLWNLGWYLQGPLAQGLGWAGLVLAGVELVLACGRQDRRAAWLLLPVIAGMGVVICVQRLVWDRWVLPLMPLLAIAAAFAVVVLADRLAERAAARLGPGHSARHGARHKARLWAGRGVVALVMAGVGLPLGLADIAQAHGRMNDTRQRASAWAVGHIPTGSTVLIEHFAFDLYPQPWRFLFPLGDAGCIDVRALLEGRVGYSRIESARGQRSNLDFGTMAPAWRATCRADFAILTQYDRYRAERGAFPQEYRAYQQLIAQGQIVASFAPAAGWSSGPVVRIVDLRKGLVESHESTSR